nr:DUF3265 domain-containing protein [Photobacterium damselae]
MHANALRRIHKVWYFHHTLILVFLMVRDSFGIALFIP